MDGQTIFAFVIEYLQRVCYYTLGQLALVFGPAAVFGFITQFLSEKIRVEGYMNFGKFYAYATAPGVVLHEFGHYIFAKIFGFKVEEVVWFEANNPDYLGYVSYYGDPRKPLHQRIGKLFIGSGPIWAGAIAISLLSFLVLGSERLDMLGISAPQQQNFSSLGEVGQYAVGVVQSGAGLFFEIFSLDTLKSPLMLISLYLILCIGAHMKLSQPDVDHCGAPALLLVGIVFAFNFGTAWIGDFSMRFTYWLTQYNHVVYALLVFVLLILVLVWLITIFLSSLKKKK